MIKSESVNSILMGVLAVSLAAAILYCYQCAKHGRDIQALVQQMATNQVNTPLLQALLNDCTVYAEKNSAINPILESVGLKVSTPAGTATKPASK